MSLNSPEPLPPHVTLDTIPVMHGENHLVDYCELPDHAGSALCRPYKRDYLKDQKGNEAIAALQNMGVRVFIIDSNVTKTMAEVMQKVRQITSIVAKENTEIPFSGSLGFQRCLLFVDKHGRLYNLTFPPHATGPEATWRTYLENFSVAEATVAMAILCRSFPCVANQDLMANLRPAYLSLILGLVLTEEISLSVLNSSMFVHASPSISAHYLIYPFGSDVLRKAIVFSLAIAGATTGKLRAALTLGGIVAAFMALLANLGARTWYFLRWKPMQYYGFGSIYLAYFKAILTGIFLPYLGHRTVSRGGKGAIEVVIRLGLIVAVLFAISDYDEIQKFLVVGSEYCDQTWVNVGVGAWWFVSFFCCLIVARRLPYVDLQDPPDGERVLQEDHSSPVGYKVPTFPDYELDPTMNIVGNPCLSINAEVFIGVVLAAAIGAAMMSVGFSDYDQELYSSFKNYTSGWF